MIAHRHAKANNGVDMDPSKPPSWVVYYDSNNLYGWAMSQPLPPATLVVKRERDSRLYPRVHHGHR